MDKIFDEIFLEDGNLVVKRHIGKDSVTELSRNPLLVDRYNPYVGDLTGIKMENILGLFEKDKCGFAFWIDMDYKGKADQYTDYFYIYEGDQEVFMKKCLELGIGIVEVPFCSECGRSLHGSFTLGDKGPLCWSCELIYEAANRKD